MNCLYITLFFNIVACIVQTFIKSWNQLLYPRVIEVCRLPFEPRHDFLHLIILVEIFPSEMFLYATKQVEIAGREVRTVRRMVQYSLFHLFIEKSYDGTHFAFGGTLDRRCHVKHVSLKQRRFYHCQTSTAHR